MSKIVNITQSSPKQEVLKMAESHPDLLGFRGYLSYMIGEYLPDTDLDDMSLEEVLDLFTETALTDICQAVTEAIS